VKRRIGREKGTCLEDDVRGQRKASSRRKEKDTGTQKTEEKGENMRPEKQRRSIELIGPWKRSFR